MLYVTDPCSDLLAVEIVPETLFHLSHENITILLLKCVVGRVKQALCVFALNALTRQLSEDTHSTAAII